MITLFETRQTEQADPRFVDLDSWSTDKMLAAMCDGQLEAVAAVQAALDSIARAADDAVPPLTRGGRIVYLGAGTSGRIGVQDGAELPATFDWPADRVVFALAGGQEALVRSVEGAEDNEADAARAIAMAKIGSDDVVIGIAASGTTPYTVAGLRAAAAAGAVTIAIAANPGTPLLVAARHPILVQTGREVIAGSTRMKAGTAQKIVLNLFSTAVMVKMGRVYRGLMVHLRASNAKLERRGKTIVAAIVGCSDEEAARHLQSAGGDVKSAILLGFGLPLDKVADALDRHQGDLRATIDEIGSDHA